MDKLWAWWPPTSSAWLVGFHLLGHTQPVPRDYPVWAGTEHTHTVPSERGGRGDIHVDSLHPGVSICHGESMHPGGQCASRGTACVHGDKLNRHGMCPRGQHVSMGTARVHEDRLNPGGQRVSMGTGCVQRDSVYPKGQHVSIRRACIHGDSMHPQGQVCPWKQPESQRTACVCG